MRRRGHSDGILACGEGESRGVWGRSVVYLWKIIVPFVIHPNIKLFRGIGMMIGSVIGVGIFGVPYAFAQSGYAIGMIELIILAGLLTVLQCMLSEMALQTPGNHRLVGFVDRYLGSKAKWFATLAVSCSIWGSILAYMIVGGRFFHTLFAPLFGGAPIIYSFILMVLAGYLIYRGLKFAAGFEFVLIVLLLMLFLVVILLCLPFIHAKNLLAIQPQNAFLPYGVVLFALTSIGIVPEIKEVLGKQAKSHLGLVVLVGMGLVTLLYLLFTFAVVGVTGQQTTQIAFEGLIPYFGTSFLVLSSVLGSLCILSIFMVLGVGLMDTFQQDFKRTKNQAWLLVMMVPILIFLLGVREFVVIIGFLGAIFGGIIGILIVRSYMRMLDHPICVEKHCLELPKWVCWILIALFLGGMVFEATHVLL